MKYIDHTLNLTEIESMKKEFGFYAKITADIERSVCIIGCELHADGEKLLLEKGSLQDSIWGGGINFDTKEIDATAILNLRPRLENNSIEILDPERRKKFIDLVMRLFNVVWTS